MRTSHTGHDAVLVIEDDAAVRQQIVAMLTDFGFAVRPFADAGEALAATAQFRPRLAFINSDLPERRGLDLARALKTARPDLTLIFITGGDSFENAVEAIRIGASDYLRKPFGSGELAITIKRHQEQRRLRQAARQAQSQYDRLVQNVPLIIFSMNPDLSLDFINNACLLTLGYSPQEAVRDRGWFLSRIHTEDRERVQGTLDVGFTCRGPFSVECRMLHKKGQSVHCIIKSMPCAEDEENGGDVRRRLEGVILDITDRVLLERAVVQDEKLKTLGAISAEVAHEIRNPLVSIGGFAQRLKKKAPELAEADIILREAMRLEKLLGRIKEYLRPVRLKRKACDVNRLVADCVNLLFPEMEQRGAWAVLGLSPDLPPVYTDEDVLSQVFVDMILYCVKAMPQGGELAVTSRESGPVVELRFSFPPRGDQPIDPDALFLPYDEGGQTIGLPLCHRLVKNMEGVLTYGTEGGKAAFTLTLPRDPQAGLSAQPEPPDPELPSEAMIEEDEVFEERLNREWARCGREVAPFSALLVDVDHFEAYVAKEGRRKARELLEVVDQEATKLLTRPSDFVEACCSQQFFVILPDTNEVGAALVAEKIRQNVALLGVRNQGVSSSPVVTVSIGVASVVPDRNLSPHEILAEAHQALFTAKKKGRNVIHASWLRAEAAE